MSLYLLINIIIFILIKKEYSYLVISIKGNDPYDLNKNSKTESITKDFLFSAIYNNLYTLMGIGNPEQNIVVKINPLQKDFLFDRNNCKVFYDDKYINKNKLSPNNVTIKINSSRIGYRKNLSKSFNNSKDMKFDLNSESMFFSAIEWLKIDDYRNILFSDEVKKKDFIYPYCQNKFLNFSFVYEENPSTDDEICGSIGLASYNGKNGNNFIEHLKDSNITKNYYWSINYISLDKGYIIFGILPHQYLNDTNNKLFNSKNFLEIYNNFAIESNHWAIEFDELFFYSNKKQKIIINNEVNADFAFTKQLIIGSLNYRSIIISQFFKEYFDKKICFEENFSKNISYSIIKCNNNQFRKEMNKFPDLYLYNKGLHVNFILSYEDLFIEIEKNIFFMIIFRSSLFHQKKEIWELGIPFLKKYQITFNSDTKKLGYYSQLNVNQNENENKDSKNTKIKKSPKTGLSLRTLAEIFFIIVFILLIIFLIKKIYNNKIRQKRPFELQDEDYDYFLNNINKKNTIDDINNQNKLITGQMIEMKKN